MNHKYTRFTITRKIALPFLLLLVLMGAISIASILGYDRVSVRTQFMENEAFKQIVVGDLRSSLASLIMAANDYIITGKVRYREIFPKCKTSVEDKIQHLLALSLGISGVFLGQMIGLRSARPGGAQMPHAECASRWRGERSSQSRRR